MSRPAAGLRFEQRLRLYNAVNCFFGVGSKCVVIVDQQFSIIIVPFRTELLRSFFIQSKISDFHHADTFILLYFEMP